MHKLFCNGIIVGLNNNGEWEKENPLKRNPTALIDNT